MNDEFPGGGESSPSPWNRRLSVLQGKAIARQAPKLEERAATQTGQPPREKQKPPGSSLGLIGASPHLCRHGVTAHLSLMAVCSSLHFSPTLRRKA